MDFPKTRTHNTETLYKERRFIYACRKGDFVTVNKLADSIDINCFNGKALRVIIENSFGPNSLNIFLKLLHNPKTDPNVADETGNTALHAAMRLNHHSAVVHLLLHPRLDVNARNADGDSPVRVAIHYCSVECLEMLLADERVRLEEDLVLECDSGCLVIADVVEARWDHIREAHNKMKQLIENATKKKRERDIKAFLKEIRKEGDVNGNMKKVRNDNLKTGKERKMQSKKMCDDKSNKGKRSNNNDNGKDGSAPSSASGTVRCFICDRVLEIGELKVHLTLKHPTASFDCANCPAKFKTMDIHKMSGHLKSVHNFPKSEADDYELLTWRGVILMPDNLTYVKCQLCKPNKILVARDEDLLRSHILINHKDVSAKELQHIGESEKYFKFFCRICGYYTNGKYTENLTSLDALLDHIDIEHSYGRKTSQRSVSRTPSAVAKGQISDARSRLREMNYNEPKAAEKGVLKRNISSSLFDQNDCGSSVSKKPRREPHTSSESKRKQLNNTDLDDRSQNDRDERSHRKQGSRDSAYEKPPGGRDYDYKINQPGGRDYDSRIHQPGGRDYDSRINQPGGRDYDSRIRQTGDRDYDNRINQSGGRDYDNRINQPGGRDYDSRINQPGGRDYDNRINQPGGRDFDNRIKSPDARDYDSRISFDLERNSRDGDKRKWQSIGTTSEKDNDARRSGYHPRD